MAKDLRQQVNEILQEYAEEVTGILDDNAKSVARKSAKSVRSRAPVGATGRYLKGITVKDTSQSRLYRSYVIYNKNKPQLTHLLEHGHTKVNGGRVAGTPHWAPAEAEAIKEYEDKIKRAIK